jgi:proline iminopeptidase
MFHSVEIPFDDGYVHCEITNYATMTNDSNVVFILPGGPGLSMLNYQIEPILKLQTKNHLVFLDPPGTGKSRKFKEERCNMQQYIECIECIRQFFDFKKVTLLGISYGTMVAVGYSIKYGKTLAGMILVAGAASYHFLEKAKENVLEYGSKEQYDLCNQLLWEGKFSSSEDVSKFFSILGALYSKTLRKSGGGSILSDKLKQYDYPFALLNLAFSSNFWQFDYTVDLKNISSPVLILSGKEDWINDPRFAKIMGREIKHSTVHILDSGHSVLYDQPEAFYELASAFLSHQTAADNHDD